MKQQINLFLTPLKTKQERFSGRVIVAWSGGMMMLAVAITAFFGWQLQQRKTQLEQLSARTTHIESTMQKIKSNTQVKSVDPLLAQQLSDLERLITQRSALVNVLTQKPEIKYDAQGYAAYFAALGRAHIEGLWLTGILVKSAGRDLLLQGKSLKPEQVPEYLAQLTQEPALRGIKFQIFALQRAVEKETGVLLAEIDFTVATDALDVLSEPSE